MNVFERSEKKSPSNDEAENKVAGHQGLVVVVITLKVPRPQFSPVVSRSGGARGLQKFLSEGDNIR